MDLRQKIQSVKENNGKALIVGLGICGLHTAKFFLESGVPFAIIDQADQEQYREPESCVGMTDAIIQAGIPIHFNTTTETLQSLMEEADLAILSPGFAMQSPIVKALQQKEIPLYSEVELALALLGGRSVVITGTNGKSTTTALTAAVLKEGGYNAIACGNIGLPVISLCTPDFLNGECSSKEELIPVVEISSYQLEQSSTIHPSVGMLLNISEDHLERHRTLEEYLKVKSTLFNLMDSGDCALIGGDLKLLRNVGAKLQIDVKYVGVEPEYCASGYLVEYRPADDYDRIVEEKSLSIDTSIAQLPGVHNRFNIAFAIGAARYFDVSLDDIQQAIKKFSGLSHRFEICDKLQGRMVINDSKSTTVASTLAAMQSAVLGFPESQISLMIGGRVKAGSWDPLWEYLLNHKQRMNSVICFGEGASELASQCEEQGIAFHRTESVQSAIPLAFETSREGDVILFSPGAASFDEFRNFEERGDRFKEWVRKDCS